VGDGTGESGTAARLRVAPPALALPPALAGDDPAALARAADFVRRARDYERRALQGVGDVVQHPPLVDSARRSYAAAAVLAPDARDWLALRQLALEPDAPARARLAVAVTTPAARDQLPAADATARGRAGDLAGAADALDAAGRPGAALAARARLAFAAPAGAAGPGPDRTGLRAALLARAGAVPAGGGTAASLQALAPTAESPGESARRAAVLLDSLFAPLAPGERLTVARALAEARDPAGRARAAAAYAAALAGGAGTPDDRLAHGRLLARAGRWRDAVSAFAGVPAGTPASPVAAYERAHALLRAGDGAAARAALRQAGADFPRDSAGASARFLLAELTADDGNEAAARAEYLRLARDVPEARLAPGAAVRAGVLALAAADARAAAEAFDLAATRWPDAPEAGAARYWAGRAHAAAGDSATARARWTAAATLGAESYYGWLASRRLGRAPWTPSAGAAVARDSAADASARRAALCEQLGLSAEAGWERDWLTRWADTSTTRLLAAAAAVVETGRPGPGIRLAQRATEGGAARSADVWRLLYPLLYAGPLAREARAAGVDPALAAALVKQESNFTADAVSPVGARGLMQLMPEVGRALWRGPGAWTPALLFRPDVNLALGMRHLDDALGGWADPAYALAAYNAGASRVRRWQRQPGATDPELFVERIPYAETRDYVRVVLRNREFYRALYAL
jgi:soluble lytic murein transglycosylase